jgi:hypothetical protein
MTNVKSSRSRAFWVGFFVGIPVLLFAFSFAAGGHGPALPLCLFFGPASIACFPLVGPILYGGYSVLRNEVAAGRLSGVLLLATLQAHYACAIVSFRYTDGDLSYFWQFYNHRPNRVVFYFAGALFVALNAYFLSALFVKRRHIKPSDQTEGASAKSITATRRSSS